MKDKFKEIGRFLLSLIKEPEPDRPPLYFKSVVLHSSRMSIKELPPKDQHFDIDVYFFSNYKTIRHKDRIEYQYELTDRNCIGSGWGKWVQHLKEYVVYYVTNGDDIRIKTVYLTESKILEPEYIYYTRIHDDKFVKVEKLETVTV